MLVTELPHVLVAADRLDHRGRALRIVTDLPISPQAPGHNAETLRVLQKAIERIMKSEPYLQYHRFELTNEGLPGARRA